MSNNNNEWLQLNALKKYLEEKQNIDNICKSYCGSFLTEYKKRYKNHWISNAYIKKFCNKLSRMSLVPVEKEFVKLNCENEFFDITIGIDFLQINEPMRFTFPFPINIHKVTEYIKRKNIQKVAFHVDDLKQLINPENFEEFDLHMQAKREGRDLLDEIKKDNPIIVLNVGCINRPYLINGTHRVIQAIRDGKLIIEAYVVKPEICYECGLSKDYELLYKMMLELYNNVYGVEKY